MNRIYLRFLVMGVALFAINCGGSGFGCGGCASSCGGDPNYKFKGQLTQNAVATRLTQAGADFISLQLKPILEGVLKNAGQSLSCSGSGITFPTQNFGNGPTSGGKAVAPSGSNCGIKVTGGILSPKAACTGSTPNSTWFYAALKGSSACGALASQSIKLKLNESDQSIAIDFAVPEIRVRSQQPELGFCYKGSVSVIPGQICAGANVSLKDIELLLSNLSGTIKMKFEVDPKTGKINLKIPTNGIAFSNNTQFKVNVNGCNNITIPVNIPVINRSVNINLGSSLCTLALNGLTGLINGVGNISFLRGLIYNLLTRVITDQLKNTDLLADARVEMELPLDSLLGGLGLPGGGETKPMGLLMQPGNAVRIVQGGLNLAFDTGFEANPASACVPKRPEPTAKPSSSPPMTGQYHIAAALSKAATDKALWAAYHTGALCLNVRSTDLGDLGGFQLNAGVFALLAPNLSKLVSDSAPVMIAIQPLQPPTATFGLGKQVNGKTDSTLKLNMRDFGVSFFVKMHDRFVRIFKLLVDVKLGITMFATPQNALEVAIDTDTLEVINPRSSQAYLVETVDIQQVLKVIVNLLVSTLGNNKISFPIDINKQLGAALGVPLGLNINGIDREGAGNDWLALKMTLTSGAKPLMPEPQTYARLHTSNPGWVKTVNGKLKPTGEVFLEVPQYLAGQELEYQYYVNFGVWSNFQTAPGGLLRVRSPFLMLLGKHNVVLRARVKGSYKTLEGQPVTVRLTFDPLAPKVKINTVDGVVNIKAEDAVTKKDSLVYEYKVNGEWQSMSGAKLKLTPELRKQSSVAIRVTDEKGNARVVNWSPSSDKVVSQTEQPAASTQGAPKAFGCTVAPSAPDTAPWWAMLLLLAPFIRRRIKNK